MFLSSYLIHNLNRIKRPGFTIRNTENEVVSVASVKQMKLYTDT